MRGTHNMSFPSHLWKVFSTWMPTAAVSWQEKGCRVLLLGYSSLIPFFCRVFFFFRFFYGFNVSKGFYQFLSSQWAFFAPEYQNYSKEKPEKLREKLHFLKKYFLSQGVLVRIRISGRKMFFFFSCICFLWTKWSHSL